MKNRVWSLETKSRRQETSSSLKAKEHWGQSDGDNGDDNGEWHADLNEISEVVTSRTINHYYQRRRRKKQASPIFTIKHCLPQGGYL
jgi:hypothetical protein